MIYFTRYHPDKSTRTINLYYDKLTENVEEYEGKNYLMVDDFTLNKALDRIKRIDFKKRDDTRILIDGDDKLPDDTTLQNDVILMTGAFKDHDKFFPQLFLGEALYDE